MVTRTPSRELIGIRPAPTAPGRLWSSTCGNPQASIASSVAATISVGSRSSVATDRDRPRVPVPRPVAEVEVRLERDERREHILERPARVPERRPRVEVRRRSSHREPRHPGRAPDELASPEGLDRGAFVRLGRVPPIEVRHHVPAVPESFRDVRPDIGAGFDQRHRPRRALGQARGDDASGRARADDHDIERRIPSQRRAPLSSSRRGGGRESNPPESSSPPQRF